jgi:hypothetical protein
VLFLIDEPHEDLPDNESWASRRMMAEDWHAALTDLGQEMGFSVYPMLVYPATGAHNGPLPSVGMMEGVEVVLEDVLEDKTILLAMTEYSATAPLIKLTEKYNLLRVASMPMISRSMEQTALAADHTEIARKGRILADKLDKAIGAKLIFSTGHEFYIDLRYRSAELDGGRVHPGQSGIRVINLPTGEAYIAPYEGEVPGVPSLTAGTIPLPCGEQVVIVEVFANRVVDVIGEQHCIGDLQEFFDLDETRRNIAELGLGVNDKAVISGNVLEDEKVWGVHLAAGRSEHIGGMVGVDSFSHPDHVIHRDVVFPFGGPIEVKDLLLRYDDGTEEAIIANRAYTIFD